MPKVYDTDVVETSTTLGPGTYTLAGPRVGYRSFDEAFDTGDTPFYVVRNAGDTKYEHNRGGIFTSGTNTLTRGVIRSSNGGAPVSWVSGDHPLLVYIPGAVEVMDLIIRGFRAASRSAWLQPGAIWSRVDFPSAGKDMIMYVNRSNVDVPLGEEEGGTAFFYHRPPGEYIDVAYAVTPGSEPLGTLICDGGAVSRTTYSKLFAKTSTIHGPGNGTSTFNKPDARGRNRIGRNNQGGTDAGVIDAAYYAAGFNTNGGKGGVKGHTGGVGVSVTVGVSGGISGSTFGSLTTNTGVGGTDVFASGGGGVAIGRDHFHQTIDNAGVTGGFSGSGSGGGGTSAFTLMQPGIIVDTLITTGGQI